MLKSWQILGVGIGTVFSYLLAASTIPNYPCYRTVEATYAAAEKIVDSHPHLASWIDIGDSWEKTAGEGGWDLMVLKLTNRFVMGPKPILFATSAIHAREYATAELMTRYAEHLAQGYGKDPNITWMLDYHEAHFLLVMNPDGRKKAEPQVMWRKNTNRKFCGATSSNRGVDLNRNFDYKWGSAGSSSECSETYRGPSGGSEPEVAAVQAYLRKLFPDRKPDSSTPAPKDYVGIYFDIHSYGEIIYQPRPTPNDKEITTLNRKLGFFNGYRPIISRFGPEPKPDDLKLRTDAREWHGGRNHTYSFGYGDLGVPSYLIELGTSFFQSCSYFEEKIVPGNFNALDYALSIARSPYITPAGPDVTKISLTKVGTNIEVEVTLDDTRYTSKSGSEETQNIAEAEYYLNQPPWLAEGPGTPLVAVDGNWDSKTERAKAILPTHGLKRVRHTLYVRAKDASGVWGPVRAKFVDLR